MKNITLQVGGMSCSACSNSLEKYLKKQPGILDASVNLVLACVSIDYEDTLKLSDLNNFITKAGFIPEGIYQIQNDKKYYQNELKWLIIFASLSVVIMYIAMGEMLGLPMIPLLSKIHHPLLFGIVMIILIIPYFIYGWSIFKNGIKNIIYLSPNMDTLITIGVIASFTYSFINWLLFVLGVKAELMNLYFESIAMVIVFVKIGRFIDMKAKEKTKDAIRELVQITPQFAKIKANGEIKEITIDEVEIDQALVGLAGERIAVDGVVESGSCHIDEAFLTGESKPVKKQAGDKVVAGSIILNGEITYLAKAIGKDSTISEIVRLVVSATNTKAKISRIADRISLFFVPTIIAIAIISFCGYLIFKYPLSNAMNAFVSVLVVACPCALGLATPLAIVISEGILARGGILVKKSTTLEQAYKIDTVIFDKTGTLTCGKLQIASNYEFVPNMMAYACSLEAKSTHPIASCFVSYAKDNQITLMEATDINAIPGMGLSGVIDNHQVIMGNAKILEHYQIDNPYQQQENMLLEAGNTIVYTIVDGEITNLIGINDVIRESAYSIIQTLQNKGIEVIMLTGDNDQAATLVATKLGIKNVKSNVLPSEKIEVVEGLLSEGHQVMMVGDGINDAPALAKSTIGVSIKSGTDIASDASDVILMKNDLSDLVYLIDASLKTMINIKENLFWAFFYNLLMIPIAIGLLSGYGLTLNPMLASLGMTCSSLCVIVNALCLFKLIRKKENKDETTN